MGHLFAEREKTANIFLARRTDLKVDINYLPLGSIKRVIRQSDDLFIIDMLVSKPKLRSQSKLQRCWPAPASKRLGKLLVTGRTTGYVLSNGGQFAHRQSSNPEAFHS